MFNQTLHQKRALFCFAILTIVLVFSATTPAAAQMTDRQWELGFAVGNANIDSSDEDFDLDIRGDLRAGYLFSDHFQLEAQLIRADAVFDAHLTALMANGVFNFRPDQSIVPYLLFGAGYSDLDDTSFLGLGPEVSEEAAAYQVGFGTRFFLGDSQQMALRIELSSLWIDTDIFENDRHTSLTAGLSWTVGKR